VNVVATAEDNLLLVAQAVLESTILGGREARALPASVPVT